MEYPFGSVLYTTCDVLASPDDTRAIVVYPDGIARKGEVDTYYVVLATGDVFVGTYEEIASCFASSDEVVDLHFSVDPDVEAFRAVSMALTEGLFDAPLLLNQAATREALRTGNL